MRSQATPPRSARAPRPPAPAQAVRERPRSLAQELVAALGRRIRVGGLNAGDRLPTEAALMSEFGVSRTVVREAISRLQASGLVRTRHGIGTFVLGPEGAAAFRIAPEELATLHDVLAVLELRLALETEAAGLAAERRAAAHLARLRAALDAFAAAIAAGRDAVDADFQFHQEIARATRNAHFAGLLATLGLQILPRVRLEPDKALDAARLAYLKRVHAEHERIFDAIAAGNAEAAREAMREHLVNSRERRRRAAARRSGHSGRLGPPPATRRAAR